MSSSPSAAEPGFARVALLGLGVVGGSLARALASLDQGPVVLGWSPDPAERRAALAAGALSEAPERRSGALAGADLVVLAAPLEACRSLMADLAREADAEATIIDVASLKAPVAEAVRAAGITERWVGCHPMAGSEASGFAASSVLLYQGVRVWTTIAAPTAAPRERRVHALWRAVGAYPASIEALEHDRRMALVSHVPQLTAVALARVLLEAGIDVSELGPGGRDMTRLAESSPTMWHDLLEHAPAEAVAGLRRLAETAWETADRLEAGTVESILDGMREAGAWRRSAAERVRP